MKFFVRVPLGKLGGRRTVLKTAMDECELNRTVNAVSDLWINVNTKPPEPLAAAKAWIRGRFW